MKLIAKPKQTGKTEELIKLAAKGHGYVVCRDIEEAARIHTLSKELKVHIQFPLSYSEFLHRRYYGAGCKCFYFDNLDSFVQYIAGNVPVNAATVTVEEVG